MSKLTLHLQRIPDWFGEFIERTEGKLAFLVGVDVFPDVPGMDLLGRTYIPDGTSNSLVDGGAAGADAWIDHFQQVYAANPHVDYWIGPNEYVLWDENNTDRFNAFHVRFIERMSALGHRVVCGQINTGWPRLRTFNDPPPYPEALAPTLASLWAHGGLFSLHEYGPGDMRDGAGAHCLRYRNTRAELVAAGLTNLPDFVITETGIDVCTDDPASDYNHWGWKHFTDWPGYLEQLQWYSRELDQDPYVRAASIFTIANDWYTFNLDDWQAWELADWIASDEPEPQPERARGFMATKYQTTLNWDLIKRESYEYAMLRVSGPNTSVNWTATEVDPWLARHVAGAESVGLLKGGFHFLTADLGGQAAVFAQGAAPYTWELPLFCDVEAAGLDRARVDRFLAAADKRLAEADVVYPALGIYTNLNLWGKLGPWDRTLWLAQWGVDEPSINGWEFWQYASGAIPDGELTSVDVYAGTPEQLYSAYGNGGEEPIMADIRAFDAAGNERDWAWVVQEFGQLDLRLAEPVEIDGTMQVVRLVKVREVVGPSTCTIKLLDINGQPVQGIAVAWYWPGAPAIDPTSPPTSRWEDVADVGTSDSAGTIGPTISEDGYYDPATGIGPYGAWILAPGHPSDGLFGLGSIAGTEHRHLDPVFQVVVVDGEPEEPEPEGDELARLADAAERIAAALEKIAGVFA